MKNKASLALMEQLVILLVFALCAALCLQAFVAADGIARENQARDQALILAQNTAESLKAGLPLPEVPENLILERTDLPPEIPGFTKAEISVFSKETGNLLISLSVGWQEVGS